MKKHSIALRGALVAVLSVLLIAFSVGGPTFSWFDRPQTKTGDSLSYEVSDEDDVRAYDGGGVTITTVYSSTGEKDSYEPLTPDPVKTSGTLAAQQRDYYETVISNGGLKAQSVSLYISDLRQTVSDVGKLCVGVNTPIKAYRNFSEEAKTRTNSSFQSAAGDVIRIYFKPQTANEWNGAGSYEIAYTTGSASINETGTGAQWHDLERNSEMQEGVYYFDAPKNINQFFFHLKGKDISNKWYSTKIYTASALGMTQSDEKVFTLENVTESGGQDDHIKSNGYSVNGANFLSYFSTASVSKEETVNLRLRPDANYIGYGVTYVSDNTNVFTVRDGVVTGVGPGTANLTVTVKGVYADKMTATTRVTVLDTSDNPVDLTDAPIITNLRVEAGKSVTVKWFIMNGAHDGGALQYSLSNIYLGL